jgi:hypothetical protein
MARNHIDWEAVAIRYRTGTESLRTIAAAFEITEGAIRKKAKAEEWARDLQQKVRIATEALLVRKTSTHDVRTEKDAIAVEAEMRSEVVIGHRSDIGRSRALFRNLLGEIEAETDSLGLFRTLGELLDESGPDATGTWRKDAINAIYQKVISSAGRIDGAKKLTEMLEKLVKLERQAFGIEDGETEKTGVEDLLKNIGRKLKEEAAA